MKRTQSFSDKAAFDAFTAELSESGAIQYALIKARNFTEKAAEGLSEFEDSPAKQSLEKLIEYVLKRTK